MTAPPSTISLSTPGKFRFRPRFRGLAIAAVVLGVLLGCFGLLSMVTSASVYAVIGGAVGISLGGLYLISPAWRLTVVADEESLSIRSLSILRRPTLRFELPWSEVVRVVASAPTQTCFVDGGDASRSLLVPGHGAPASYDIENKVALYKFIIAQVPEERIEWVELLERAHPGSANTAG